jgi:hypothetical protein
MGTIIKNDKTMSGWVHYSVPPTFTYRGTVKDENKQQLQLIEWPYYLQDTLVPLQMAALLPMTMSPRDYVGVSLVYGITVHRNMLRETIRIEFKRVMPAPAPTDKLMIIFKAPKARESDRVCKVKNSNAVIMLVPNDAVLPTAKQYVLPVPKQIEEAGTVEIERFSQQQEVPDVLPPNVIKLPR